MNKCVFIFLIVLALTGVSLDCLQCDYVDNTHKKANLMEPYPLNSGGKKHLDEKGIMLIDYAGKLGKIYNPVSISQYAHNLYINFYNTGKIEFKDAFIKQADWLVENQVNKNGMGIWIYEFDNKPFGAKPPWISAMAQGLAISVLSEAFSITQDDKYLKSAELALKTFQKSVESGGVVSYWPNGDIWYEEVATIHGNKILNGFIFSLAGVYDYYKLTGSLEAKSIVYKGIESLNNHIEEYDLGFVSRYSLLPDNIHWGYNSTHAYQLAWANQFFKNDDKLLTYAKKFKGYDPIPYIVNATNSSNPKKFGQYRLNDKFMFWSYWSSRKFPVELELKFGKSENQIKGIIFYCVSKRTCPKDYNISISDKNGNLDREYTIIQNFNEELEIVDKEFHRTNDSTFIRIHRFKAEANVNSVIIKMLSTNGNRSVAIREISFITNRDKDIQNFAKKMSGYVISDPE